MKLLSDFDDYRTAGAALEHDCGTAGLREQFFKVSIISDVKFSKRSQAQWLNLTETRRTFDENMKIA